MHITNVLKTRKNIAISVLYLMGSVLKMTIQLLMIIYKYFE